MLLYIPLTTGAMKQHAIAFLNNVNYDLAFIDASAFNVEQLEPYRSKLRFITKGVGLKKLLWSCSILEAYSLVSIAASTKEKKIFIVNGEFLPFLFFLSFIARIRGVETIVCWHDVTPHVGNFSNYLYWLIAFCNTLIASKVVTHSKNYQNRLRTSLLYKSKLHYVPLPPYGFDISPKIQLLNGIFQRNGLKSGKYYVFLGRLEYYKGVHNILETFLNLGNKKLLIAGPGEMNYVKSLIKKNVQGSNIIILEGYLEETDFLFLIANAKCILMPYLHASQSVLPYIAASLSTPIISSSATGISDLVIDLNGYVYSTEQELVSLLKTVSLRATRYDKMKHLAEFKALFQELVR
jgi:glycosyltransferase involved in cell wall biosynthesis